MAQSNAHSEASLLGIPLEIRYAHKADGLPW
jgi:hypothetical protein